VLPVVVIRRPPARLVDGSHKSVISTVRRRDNATRRVGDENKIHIQLLVASLPVADTTAEAAVARPAAWVAHSVHPFAQGASHRRRMTAMVGPAPCQITLLREQSGAPAYRSAAAAAAAAAAATLQLTQIDSERSHCGLCCI